MTKVPGLALATLFLLAGFSGPAGASPCTRGISQTQKALDARIEAAAARGPSRPESKRAGLDRQPTPASIARAEQHGRGRTRSERALSAIAMARLADGRGDGGACEKALNQARVLIK